MKHRNLGLAMVLAWALCAQAGVLVTDLQGQVHSAEKGAVALLVELPDGTRLTLAADAQMVGTDLTSGREYLLKGPGQFRVEKTGVLDAAGVPVPQRALPGGKMPEVRVAVARVAQAALTLRGEGFSSSAPSPLVPARTAVLTATPTLKWAAVDGATGYQISVHDGAAMVRQATTSATEWTLPALAALSAGKSYIWRVEAMGAQGRIADASTTISVVTVEQMRLLDQLKPASGAPYSLRVLYAAQLQEVGATDEARREWRMLAKERPEDPNLEKLAR